MKVEEKNVAFKGAEIVAIVDAMTRVVAAVTAYEQPMFLAGPKPTYVLIEVIKSLQDKLDATVALTPGDRVAS